MAATLIITIEPDRVRDDVRLKSHLQTKTIPDPEARDAARADIMKLDEINRNLLSARSDLLDILNPFLFETSTATGNDQYAEASLDTQLTFEFDITNRRLNNRAKAIADAVHAYLVDNVLHRFYLSVAQGDLAAVEAQQMAEDKANLERMLYTKLRPTYNA